MGSARRNTGAFTPEHRLLHPTSDNEDTRKANIRDWLFSIGISRVETEYPTGAGPADIYLPNRRIIIETKRKGKAMPDMPAGARLDETCMEQLVRYVSAERLREQRALDEDDNRDLPWIGILTDSQAWHVWVWSDTGPEYVDGWNGRRLDQPGVERLSKLLQRTVGREWAPGDPTDLFDGHLSSLVELYERRRSERDVVTQRELWHRQLRMSGNQPAADHADRLFILHTLLISVSTKISEMYGNADTRYGFASWVRGTPWLDGLNTTIRRYNWRQQTGDVLRALYMGLVDRADRHIYGEYYTPDWLAEWLCREVIDDAYIDGWVRTGKGGGVMDPACGSGTFLYHAVRRIVESEPVRAATMGGRDLTDMVVGMIHGVDIHPVAVAMAKANVLRALPDRPGVPLHIYQGDSLQISRNVDDDAQQRIDELESDVFTVVSRRGAEIRFPLEFIAGEGFDGKMHRFAKAASLGNPFPPGLDGGMADGRRSMLHRAFRTLTGVCRDEGNDVWAWYVINQAGIYMLKGRIARVVANPPWVRISNIQDPARKAETESLAKDLGLWAGANNATGFNTAALFAVQCGRLYGAMGMVSGWVLPDAAMRGGNWAAYSKKVDPPAVYDLGGLPFPKHSGACVNMLGVPRQGPQRMVLNGGGDRPGQREGWESVRQRVSMEPVVRDIPKKSMWFEGKRPIARQGAILTPSCLVILDAYSVRGGGVACGTTARSRHGAWRGKSFSAEVPRSWVHPAWFGKGGLLPYALGTPRNVIIPIDGSGEFLPDRDDTKWWRDATDTYAANRGSGRTTPETLEEQLAYKGKLSSQFPAKRNVVLYNASGSNMCAARMTKAGIVDSSLYRVATRSKREALFLIAILNSDVMQERFRRTRKSDRHFSTYFWNDVPIPRFNKNNKHHVKLAELAKRAEAVARGAPPNRNKIRKAIRSDGVGKKMDGLVTEIMKECGCELG